MCYYVIISSCSAESNCGLTPYNLAAQCGYPDCTLYIKRVADQQLLKQQGVIADTVLPVVHAQSVLPGLKPDMTAIAQVRVVDRVLGPVLAQGSTATGSLAHRVKPERLASPGNMEMTTGTIIAKDGLYMQSMYEYSSNTSVC